MLHNQVLEIYHFYPLKKCDKLTNGTNNQYFCKRNVGDNFFDIDWGPTTGVAANAFLSKNVNNCSLILTSGSFNCKEKFWNYKNTCT